MSILIISFVLTCLGLFFSIQLFVEAVYFSDFFYIAAILFVVYWITKLYKTSRIFLKIAYFVLLAIDIVMLVINHL